MSEKVKPDIIGLTASLIVWGIRQFKGSENIMDVIVATHLQNKENVRPTLIKTHPTDSGVDYIFSLPPGVIKADFEKNRVAFETYLNSTCEIESTGRRLTLKTYKVEFPTMIKFEFDPSLY